MLTIPASTRVAPDDFAADSHSVRRNRLRRRSRRTPRSRRAGVALAGVLAGRRARDERAPHSAHERTEAVKFRRRAAGEQPGDALLAAFAQQDAHVEEHVERVGELSAAVAKALGLPNHETRRIGLAGRLHDIGKAAIPSAILGKAGPLNEHEWHCMRQHTVIGERFVLASGTLAETAPLIRSSHERVDGNGYPDRLRGSSIPLGSRIIAVCDAFDAMTTDRVYRRAVGTGAALAELMRHAGSQFDPTVVEALSKLPSLRHAAAAEPAA